MEKELKKSDKKYIRIKKAEIRNKVYDVKKQKEMIAELYKNVLGGAGVVKEVKLVKKAKPTATKNSGAAKQKGKADAKAGAKMKNKKVHPVK